MINLERLEQAIAVMKRAGKVNMGSWQTGEVRETEAELHECGTAACFAGWLAVSPEFQAADGGLDTKGAPGMPAFNKHHGGGAVAEWLEVEHEEARMLIELLVFEEAYVSEDVTDFLQSMGIPYGEANDGSVTYLLGWGSWTAEDVVHYLERLKREVKWSRYS